ncbi:hypothetical protein PAXINDRAFT_6902 [Paxillus involutus ATCC 200175]|nr:hypothetical protein PAXINDRAFT_6902 [Paxillus involutus ATCC 200175]
MYGDYDMFTSKLALRRQFDPLVRVFICRAVCGSIRGHVQRSRELVPHSWWQYRLDRSRPSVYGAAGSPTGPMVDQDDEDDDYFTDSDDPDPDRFVSFSQLSHLAVRLRDKVPRGTHVKSSIPYLRAFLNLKLPLILKIGPARLILPSFTVSRIATSTGKRLYTRSSLFIRPLRCATHMMPASKLDEFIEEVFGNILDLRECNKRLVEAMYVQQREQAPIIQKIGDVFVEAAKKFPICVSYLRGTSSFSGGTVEANVELRPFLEVRMLASVRKATRISTSGPETFLDSPLGASPKVPTCTSGDMKETTSGNPDAYYLAEAIHTIKNLHNVSQLRTSQIGMDKGPTGKWEWHDLVAKGGQRRFEQVRGEAITFELIKGEMGYVKDLENIELMYVQPLRALEPPIIYNSRVFLQCRSYVGDSREALQEHMFKLTSEKALRCAGPET